MKFRNIFLVSICLLAVIYLLAPTSNANAEVDNSFAPSNYYIPLDDLSPTMTYTLCFVAMVFGIAGSVLVIRDPKPRVRRSWSQSPRFTQRRLV